MVFMGIAAEEKFAFFYDFFFEGALKAIRNKNLEIISKYHCKKIIDLGCGTGSQSRALSKKSGLLIVGVDNSKKMLNVAKKKNNCKTTFIRGDITRNTFPDETFDCAIITLVLHPNDQETIRKIVKEAKRVIAKGGIISITDYDYGNSFKGKIAEKFMRIIESLTNESHRKNYFGFMKQGALEEILSKEGYQVLESIPFYNGALKTCVIT